MNEEIAFGKDERAYWKTPRNLTAVGVPGRLDVRITGIIKNEGQTTHYSAVGVFQRRPFDITAPHTEFEKFKREDD